MSRSADPTSGRSDPAAGFPHADRALLTLPVYSATQRLRSTQARTEHDHRSGSFAVPGSLQNKEVPFMASNLVHPGADGPSGTLDVITPNDAADLPGGATRGLFVGVGGSIAVRDLRGVDVVLVSGDAQYHPVRVRRVLASGTVASNIVALY
jgi:hypothetical protein